MDSIFAGKKKKNILSKKQKKANEQKKKKDKKMMELTHLQGSGKPMSKKKMNKKLQDKKEREELRKQQEKEKLLQKKEQEKSKKQQQQQQQQKPKQKAASTNSSAEADNPPQKLSQRAKKRLRKEMEAAAAMKNTSTTNSSDADTNTNDNTSSSNNKNKSKKQKKGKLTAPSSFSFPQNLYLDAYHEWRDGAPQHMNRIFDVALSDKQRTALFDYLDPDMADKYAWAIPDERSLRIIASHGPIVEIGAGKGYWGSLLQGAGVDYAGYDIHVAARDAEFPPWCVVRKGGPEKIKKHKQHTLMLCYPDDYEDSEQSMASECLKHYKGDTIILIGESFAQTLGENPFGKTAGADFQIDLAASFHKVLQVPLPSWPGSMDTLQLWKRTKMCMVDDIPFRSIPNEERMDLVQSCPATEHLL